MSSANVVKLKKQGMPVDSVDAARAWRERQQSIAKRKPEPAQVVGGETFRATLQTHGSDLDESHDQARTRREIAEANLAELREGELSLQLIRVDAVRSAWAGKITAARDALLQVPARLGPQLAAEGDLVAVMALLEAEMRQVLADLSAPQSQG